MIIQHNIAAFNTNRQLGIVTKNLAKSTEKLSSGYKINRAADDAAGLSISEKMQKQIRGLSQGVSNAEDGISLCQVADGALVEVTDMLQRMNELAVKAANGTLSASDREAIESEVTELKTEIDRVSKTTKFNEIILFDRGYEYDDVTTATTSQSTPPISTFPSNSVTQITQASLAGLPSTVVNGITHYTLGAGTYQFDSNITNAVFEISGDTVIKNSSLKEVSFSCAAGTHLFVQDVKIENTGNESPIEINGTGNTLTFSGTNTFDNGRGAIHVGKGTDLTIEGDGTLNAYGGSGAGIGGKRIDNASADVGDWGTITINSGKINATTDKTNIGHGAGAGIGSSVYSDSTGTLIVNGGDLSCLSCQGAGIGSGWNAGLYYNTYSNQSSGTVIINGGNVHARGQDGAAGIGGAQGRGGADVTINGGVVDACCWYADSSPSDVDVSAAGIGAGAIFADISNTATSYDSLTKPMYFGKLTINGGEVTSYGGFTSVASAGYPLGVGELIDDANRVTQQNITEYRAQYNENNYTADGKPITISDMTKDTQYGRYVYRYTNTATATNNLQRGAWNLWIQSGAEAGDGLFLTLYDINTYSLKINDLSCLTENLATQAIDQISFALSEVSKQRSILGAQQNRLEHTIKNENNIIENTTAAESQIRDTDMATEMVRYSKCTILAQAGQSMLAQANQLNQGVLSLLSA